MPHSIEGEHWTEEQRDIYLHGMAQMVESMWFNVEYLAGVLLDVGEITEAKYAYLTNPKRSTSCPAVDNADERQMLELIRALHDRMNQRLNKETER